MKKEKNVQKNDFIMDTCVARRLLGNCNYLSPLKFRTDCDWKSSRILVPEQVVYELGKQGVSLGELASAVRRSLGSKLYKIESTPEEFSISQTLLGGPLGP